MREIIHWSAKTGYYERLWVVVLANKEDYDMKRWKNITQGNYCNPFFIVSKSSVDETILKTVLPHFSNNQLPRYRWRHNLLWPQKLFFQTCLNYTSLGCFLCTDQFLINYHGFRIQGKRDITSDAKRYDVITVGKKVFFEHSHIIYHSRDLSLLIIFLLEDHDLKITEKRNIWHFI